MEKRIDTLIVSDIFGRTEALEKLCIEIGTVSQIIDPYAGRQMTFSDETNAYQYFTTEVGLERYQQILHNALLSYPSTTRLVGFSVGATAIWLHSAQLNKTAVNHAICFYASQIRHSTNIEPAINLNLIMPKSEPHLSVSGLAEQLRNKAHVTIQHSDYLHGFMNPLSDNFDTDAYHFYLDWLNSANTNT